MKNDTDSTLIIESILKLTAENGFKLYDEYRKIPVRFIFKRTFHGAFQELHITEDDFYNFELILKHKNKNEEIVCKGGFIDKKLNPIQPEFNNKYIKINSKIAPIKRYEYYNNPYRLCLVLSRLKKDIEKYCINAFSKMISANPNVPEHFRNDFIKISYGYENMSLGVLDKNLNKYVFEQDAEPTVIRRYKTYFLIDLFENLASGDIDKIEEHKDYIIDASVYLKKLLEKILYEQKEYRSHITNREDLIYFKVMTSDEIVPLDPLQMILNAWYKPFSKSFYKQLLDLELIEPLDI